MASTITATVAQERAAADGHELGCFETALELIVEAADAEGVRLCGDINETWRGMANAERAHMWMNSGRIACHCAGDGPATFTGRRAYPLPSED